MKSDEENTGAKIFRAALDLIMAGEDARRLTTRRIAEKAEVNPALVNYYYRSKESLLSQAVGTMMGGIIERILREREPGGDAEARLRNILTATADAAFTYLTACRIAVASELKEGCRNSCAMVRPLLGEMFPDLGKEDLDIAALQLMLPFHHILLEPELYGKILDTDFSDAARRRNTINRMTDRALYGLKREVEP